MGSLSLIQGIFLTQDSKRGLRHYRQILYQLSYLGSPFQILSFVKRSQRPLEKWLILGLSQEKNTLSLDCLLYQKIRKETGPRRQSGRLCARLFLPEHQNHNQLLNNHQQEDTGTYQKRYPVSKDKEEATTEW